MLPCVTKCTITGNWTPRENTHQPHVGPINTPSGPHATHLTRSMSHRTAPHPRETSMTPGPRHQSVPRSRTSCSQGPAVQFRKLPPALRCSEPSCSRRGDPARARGAKERPSVLCSSGGSVTLKFKEESKLKMFRVEQLRSFLKKKWTVQHQDEPCFTASVE